MVDAPTHTAPAPAPVDTVAELLAEPDRLLPAVLTHLETNHARSQQTYPGHSSVGRCPRQAAYGYAGVAPDPEYLADGPPPSIQAWIGTAVHTEFLPAMRALLHPARIELATTWRPTDPSVCAEHLGWGDPGNLCSSAAGHPGPHHADGSRVTLPPITGHIDLERRQSKLVLDLKTGSRHTVNRVRREGPRLRDLLQVHANAASRTAEGKSVTTVGLLYVSTETSMDRADPDGLLYLQPVDPHLVRTAAQWWADVVGAGDTDPDQAERTERGPGLSWACDGCPFLRRCWGPAAVPGQVGAQSLLAVEDDALASALAMYAQAGQEAADAGRAQRKAKADQEFAAAIIAGQEEGTYRARDGRLLDLRWKRGALRLDQAEARRVLAELNVGAPMKRDRTSAVVTVMD